MKIYKLVELPALAAFLAMLIPACHRDAPSGNHQAGEISPVPTPRPTWDLSKLSLGMDLDLESLKPILGTPKHVRELKDNVVWVEFDKSLSELAEGKQLMGVVLLVKEGKVIKISPVHGSVTSSR